MQPIDLKSIGTQTTALWGRMKPFQKAALVLVLIGTVAVIAFLSLGQSEPPYAVLFSQLAQDDAAGIVEALKAEKIEYKIESGGTAITVPEARVQETRLALASKGIPRGGGVGFELFDKQSFATTTFVEEMNYRRALAGELSRTISSLDPIERARVHIAMQERSLYRKDEGQPAVSVAVRLRPGRTLSKTQLKGIVHLVSSSIARLTPDNVTVVDESGAVLWAGDENNAITAKQREIERTLRDRVREIMDRVVGAGQSVVVVTATMETSQSERTEELFDKNSAVLRSQSRTEQNKYGMVVTNGLTGVKANVPETAEAPNANATVNAALKTGNGSPKDSKLSETKNYEMNRVLNRITEDPIKVKRLHIAILINGALEASTASTATILGSNEVGSPSMKVNLTRVAALAREAAGLDMERGDRLEVHSIPFVGGTSLAELASTATATAAIPAAYETWQLMAAGGAAFFAVLVAIAYVLLSARRAKKRLQAEQADAEAAAALEEMKPKIAPPLSTRDRVRQAVRRDADRAAKILSSLLRENEESA